MPAVRSGSGRVRPSRGLARGSVLAGSEAFLQKPFSPSELGGKMLEVPEAVQ